MASADSDDQNDENYWKITCNRRKICRSIRDDLNTTVSAIISSNDTWTEPQNEAFKKRFVEIYENDFLENVLVNGENVDHVDVDEEENQTTEFDPIDQDIQQKLALDLPLSLNNAVDEIAKRRKAYPPYCKHYLMKELRIKCRCLERLKVTVKSSTKIKDISTHVADMAERCNENKGLLRSAMDEMSTLMKDIPSTVEKAKGLEQLSLLEIKAKPARKRRQSSKCKTIRKSSKEDIIVPEMDDSDSDSEKESCLTACNVLLGRSCCVPSTFRSNGSPSASNLRKSGACVS